jgi:dynein heavy chain
LAEDIVLMRALRDMNMPKFVFDDVPLFHGLIQDLFPGLRAERVGNENLKELIVENMDALGFKHSEETKFED